MLTRIPVAGARIWLAVLALSLVGALALAGCSSSGPASAGGVQQVNVKMNEFKFEPSTITVKANQPVKITVENTGAVRHDWSVNGLDTEVKLVADPGKSASTEFTPTKTGTFEIVCGEPGHLDAGMKGQFIVQ